MKKNSNNAINIILIFTLLAGLSLLLYPSVSNYWNSFHQSKVIAEHVEQVSELDEAQCNQLWGAAVEYNTSLKERNNDYIQNEIQKEQYSSLLDVTGTGVMGYIEIPTIQCTLPIYHGTDDSILQVAVGHLEWSSLPVGGESSHCVLSGHRGLPSAKLFSNLDKLSIGDIFELRVLNEVLTYEVDQILIVKPDESDNLRIIEGKDYCTLVTCTPYGVNSHRLLVRGHRVDNTEETKTVYVTADAIQIEPLLVAPVIASPILFILLVLLLLPTTAKRTGGADNE